MVNVMANSIANDQTVDSFYAALVETARLQQLINKGQQAINDRKASISQTLMELAKDECDGDKEEFLKRCASAEVSYKASGKSKQLPKQWTQAKSNIKGAMELDLDLKLYTTESSLRKDAGEKRKEIKAAKAKAAEAAAPIQWSAFRAGEVQIAFERLEAMDRTDIADGLVNDFLAQLSAVAEAIDVEHGEVIEGEVIEYRTA
jgi:hypothetical protein